MYWNAATVCLMFISSFFSFYFLFPVNFLPHAPLSEISNTFTCSVGVIFVALIKEETTNRKNVFGFSLKTFLNYFVIPLSRVRDLPSRF